MMTLVRNTFFSGLMAASLFAHAPAKAPKTPLLISSALADGVAAITPPPALNSKKMAKNLAEIYAIHRAATPQELESANWDNKHEDVFAIAKVLGENLTRENMPALAALWADMNNDQSIFVSAAKKYFQHPRPYDLDSNIKSVCGSKPGGAKNSYPSGHGTVGYLSALVLTMMVPEKGEVLRVRAEEYAHNRVDHYAADLQASKEAAALVLGNMLANARFQQELAAAKTEL